MLSKCRKDSVEQFFQEVPVLQFLPDFQQKHFWYFQKFRGCQNYNLNVQMKMGLQYFSDLDRNIFGLVTRMFRQEVQNGISGSYRNNL